MKKLINKIKEKIEDNKRRLSLKKYYKNRQKRIQQKEKYKYIKMRSDTTNIYIKIEDITMLKEYEKKSDIVIFTDLNSYKINKANIRLLTECEYKYNLSYD